jgi:hypothetical protein
MTTASTQTRSKPMSATWALSRREGRRLVTHPAVLVGLAFGAALMINNRLAESDVPAGFGGLRVIPITLAIGTFIAANLGALRNRRHGTSELYEAEPLPARQRTAAHLLSVLWAVAVAVGLSMVILVALAVSGGLDVGFVDGIRHRTPTIVELIAAPTVVGLFGVVGIMMARWIPSVVVPLLALVAALPYLVIEAWTVVEGPSGWYTPLWSAAREAEGRWIDVSAGNGYSPVVDFAIAALAWHLVFLVGVITIASVVALAKHGLTRRLLLAGGVGVGVAVLGAVMQISAATPWL